MRKAVQADTMRMPSRDRDRRERKVAKAVDIRAASRDRRVLIVLLAGVLAFEFVRIALGAIVAHG